MSYKTELANNNTDLQTILDMANGLPEAPTVTELCIVYVKRYVGTTYYINKKAPNLSATGNYNLIWEWDKACSKWVCGLLSKGEA